jgi:uncharacterized membrane protein YczE
VTTADLRPLPVSRAPGRRLPQLIAGLALYGTSMAMQLRATLGVDPWDVFHQGLARHLPLSFGLVTALTGVAVQLLWLPLRQRPGVGTVANVVVIALSVDAALWLILAPSALPARVALMVGGIVLNGVASAAYIGARLGPGPRDGLMTGLAARTGWSIRLVRTGIELTVLAVGWLLGGTVGVGTVAYALAIGPLTQAFLPWFVFRAASAVEVGQGPRPHHDQQHGQRGDRAEEYDRAHRDGVVAQHPDQR